MNFSHTCHYCGKKMQAYKKHWYMKYMGGEDYDAVLSPVFNLCGNEKCAYYIPVTLGKRIDMLDESFVWVSV